MLGYDGTVDKYVELCDEWYEKTLNPEEKNRLEAEKKLFIDIPPEEIMLGLITEKSPHYNFFICNHRTLYGKAWARYLNEKNRVNRSKLDEERLKKCEEALNKVPHKDKCCFWRRSTTILTRKIPVNMKESQLNQIRYDANTNFYEGMIHYAVAKNNVRRCENLDNAWVKQNFEKEFLQQLKKKAGTTRKFFKVPPGNASTSPEVPKRILNMSLPVTVFRQSANEKSCLLMSFANAIHFRGFEQESWKIFNRCSDEKAEYVLEIFKQFRDIIKEIFPHHKLESLASSIDTNFLISNINSNFKSVAVLSSDGDSMHSITIWKDIIFDSTLERALPLCIESFHFIVGEKCNFIGIDKGYEISLETNYFQSKKEARKRRRDKQIGAKLKKNKAIEVNDEPATSKQENLDDDCSSSCDGLGVL